MERFIPASIETSANWEQKYVATWSTKVFRRSYFAVIGGILEYLELQNIPFIDVFTLSTTGEYMSVGLQGRKAFLCSGL